MYIVDSQVHIWGADTPDRPWPPGRAHEAQKPYPVTKDMLIREMDAAAVSRIVLVPPSWEGDRNDLALEAARQQIERWGAVDAPDTMLPIVRAPGDISVIVVGGAGKHSSWQPTFGDGTRPTRRVIWRRDGTPVRRVADLGSGGARGPR
jgi:hypothetical protein